MRNLDLWVSDDSEMEILGEKAGGIVLTDDYAPVEHLLASVVRYSGVGYLATEYVNQAEKLQEERKWDESISRYREAVRLDPDLLPFTYNNIGFILGEQGKLKEAIVALKKAWEYNDKSEFKKDMRFLKYNIAVAFKKLGRNALVKDHNLREATKYFQQAVDVYPQNLKSHFTLVQSLVDQKRYDEAITTLEKAKNFFGLHLQDKEAVARIEGALKSVKFEKLEHKK